VEHENLVVAKETPSRVQQLSSSLLRTDIEVGRPA
jgi:hypothetical protein